MGHVHSITLSRHCGPTPSPSAEGEEFEWNPEHTKVVRKLKKALWGVVALKKPNYERLILVMVSN